MLLTAVLDLSELELSIWDICLRLLCALVVGIVIGTEREYSHRPAGMRTHMLVSLGACVVMITGQMIYAQYRAYGGTPDPARLSAQVITGVGFLGAGTILREGPTVKGLTTAASLWAVACLGIAAGGGYYTVALAGMVFIFVTLTIFELFQRKLLGSQSGFRQYTVVCGDVAAGLGAVTDEVRGVRAVMDGIRVNRLGEDVWEITFRLDFPGARPDRRKQRFLERLGGREEIRSVSLDAASVENGT